MPGTISANVDLPADQRTSAVRHATSVITSLQQCETVGALWRARSTSPFVDFEFFRWVLECRSPSVRPFVVVLWLDERPVALLIGRLEETRQPLTIGYAKLAELSVRQVTFIADGYLGATSAENLHLILAQVDRSLGEEGIPLAVFEQVGLPSPLRAGIEDAFGRLRTAGFQGVTRHWSMTPPASWAAFLAGMTAKHRYWLNRLPKVLEREFPGRWSLQRYRTEEDVERFLDGAERVARSTYQRRLGAGFVRDHEYTGRVALDARNGRLRGYILSIDGSASAFWYCLRYADKLHLIATAFDVRFRRYELGTILLMEVVRDHCDGTIASIDFGIGDALYKERFGSDFRDEGPVHVYSKTLKGRALHTVFSILQLVRVCAKAMLERFALTQKIKTAWRRRLTRDANHEARSDERA